MVDDFLLIAVTPPHGENYQAEFIVSLFNQGFNLIHIRKPHWTIGETERLIQSLPEKYYNKLRLHDYHSLAVKYGLGGVHINSRNPVNITMLPYSVSCHSLDELQRYDDAEYKFLSPVFPSISKPGYRGEFDLKDLGKQIRSKNVVALGGVTFDKLQLIKNSGFKGAAIMGALMKSAH